MADWDYCHQINPSVLPYALEFAIELFVKSYLVDVNNLIGFNLNVENYLLEKHISHSDIFEKKRNKKMDR